MSLQKKRIAWIDCAKGILILLVMYGHTHWSVNSDIEKWVRLTIYSFHMAGFFILTGLTFNANKNVVQFFKDKAKRLLLPYVTFSFLYLTYKYLTSVFFGGPTFNFVSGFSSIIFPVSGSTETSVYGLWFFPCLFITNIFAYLILKLPNLILKIGLYFLVLLLCYYSCSLGVVSAYSLSALSLSFILIGYYIKDKVSSWISSLKYNSLFILLFILCLWLNYYLSNSIFDYSSMNYGSLPLYIVCSLTGSMMIFSLSNTLVSFAKSNYILVLGRDSMYYYGLHYMILGVVSKVFANFSLLQLAFTLLILYFVIPVYKKITKQ